MSLLPLLDLGSSANDGTGDTLRAGGQLINDKFSELYPLVLELGAQRTYFVDGIMGDDATGAPYEHLSAALSAITGGGTADAPWTIILQGGDVTQAASITMALGHVHIKGQGIKASRILFENAAGLTVNASNITISDLTIERSGSNAAFVLSVNTTGLANWKNLRLDRVSVVNASGTAIGTFSGDARDINIFAKIGIDWCYGGRLFNPFIHAHDPALGAASGGYPTSACIARIQACAPSLGVLGGKPVFSATEEYLVQRGGVFGGYLINTDPNGICVNGLSEDYLGDNTTTDWYYQLFSGAPGTPLNGGQPYVSWYPSPLIGTYFIGPQLQPGGTVLDLGTHARGVGTGGALRGTLRILNCEVYGTRWASYLRDSDVQGGSWINENSNYGGAMDVVQSCTFTGTSFLLGDSRVGYLDAVRRLTLGSHCMFSNCHNQGSWVFLMEGYQHMMLGCTEMEFREADTGFLPKHKRAIFGWTYNEPQAVRLNAVGDSLLRTVVTGAYSITPATWECWFRCDNTKATQVQLFAYSDTGTIGTGYTLVAMTPSTLNLTVFAGSATVFSGTAPNYADKAWHHIALVITGGTGRVWLDGVALSAAVAGVTVGGTSGLSIGAAFNAVELFYGDITEFRISSVARYTVPFTPKVHFSPDADTVSLWSDSTRRNLGWSDQMYLHDMWFGVVEATSHLSAPNLPYWVRRNRSLEWLHATQP